MAAQSESADDTRVFECLECGETSVFSVSVRRERGGHVLCPCCGSVDLIEPRDRHDPVATQEVAA
jgi:transcription elongation factor Elf1